MRGGRETEREKVEGDNLGARRGEMMMETDRWRERTIRPRKSVQRIEKQPQSNVHGEKERGQKRRVERLER